MPNKEFLEEFPLYRKLNVDVPPTLDLIKKININMYCPKCNTNQTFVMKNEYYDGFRIRNHQSGGSSPKLEYECTHCQEFQRDFLIYIDYSKKWLMKTGQYPAWDIKGDPLIEKMLGKYSEYYKKGLICESQSYGIGAFGYYRRIVENIIDDLLDEIKELLSGDQLNTYQKALEKTKQTKVAQEKIEIVKDLLPPILRPNGMNPLSTLHSVLSEGIHAKSDEECIEYAESCRQILSFLVNQVMVSKSTSKTFTDNMRKILDKKSKS